MGGSKFPNTASTHFPSTPKSVHAHSHHFTPTRPLTIPKGTLTVSPSGGHVTKKSFDWTTLLRSEDADYVPVTSFKSAPLFDVFDDILSIGLKVEVRNIDCSSFPNGYWIASVVKFAGYFVCLRYEGFNDDASKDFWINIFHPMIHPVGWCASQGNTLIPPDTIKDRNDDWKTLLYNRLMGSKTLPSNYLEQLQESLKSRFEVGMKLEVVDKSRIAAVRVAVIDQIIGGRLHVSYEGEDSDFVGFWCHQYSPLIHPIGWAQLVGHELKATEEYAKKSLYKAMNNVFEEGDATWTLFPPVKQLTPIKDTLTNSKMVNGLSKVTEFKEGMKLEAIDPLNLSTICVATVVKVLRCNYLMIGIDGVTSPDGSVGSDWFCYHASSPCIFPVGFCQANGIPLTPPAGYEGPTFNWSKYLQETNSTAAPVALFKNYIPNHKFKEGQYLEAVDLMDPRLVCVATVAKVVGRLLKIHFNGWDESYDQWIDCESPELFPIGWCDLVGYPLEAPRDTSIEGRTNDSSKTKKRVYKGTSGRKRKIKGRINISLNSSTASSTTSTTPILDEDVEVENSQPEPPTTHIRRPDISAGRPIVPPTTAIHNLSHSQVIVKPCPPPEVPVLPTSMIAAPPKEPNPRNWTVNDVAGYFMSRKDAQGVKVANAIITKKIDGKTLFSLTEDEIMDLVERKVGPGVRLRSIIDSLRNKK